MPYKDLWLVDRSRIENGHACAAKRYYGYHAGQYGKGFTRIAQSLPLLTGIALHSCLADLLTHVQGGETVTPELEQLVVSIHAEKYKAIVGARGFSDEDPNVELLIREQCVLLATLVYSWVRVVLPIILEDWEILHVEQEFDFPLTIPGPDTLLMIRPDVVLRHRRTGEVVIWDWKTAAYINDNYVQEWSSSPQMMLTAHVVSRALGVEVKSFYIGAVNKGQRKPEYNELTGKWDGPIRQQSLLVWPYYHEGTPPFVGPQWRPERKYACEEWHTCSKARGKAKGNPHNHVLGDEWERRLIENPYGWVQDLPMERLQEVHQLLGPYEVEPYKAEQMVRAVTSNEDTWQERVMKQYRIEEKYPWDSVQVQEHLDKTFPRSYKCFSFGRRCAFYDLCFKKSGWQNPLGSGYLPRRPHHDQEIMQMKERGIPVPDEYGDFEEGAE